MVISDKYVTMVVQTSKTNYFACIVLQCRKSGSATDKKVGYVVDVAQLFEKNRRTHCICN